MAGKKIKNGQQAFNDYFREIYGDRWTPLQDSLNLESVTGDFIKGLIEPYYLDKASLYPVSALDVKRGDSVLDMCAAPGGKSLQIALACLPEGSLILNDSSGNRLLRLKKVIAQHLPSEIRNKPQYSNRDANLFGLHYKNQFDRILLDAPCSSERHLLHHPEILSEWSIKRGKSLHIRQHSLLCSALEALKPNGRLVYSTCSINPVENDGVIEKFLKKRHTRVNVIQYKDKIGEQTDYGRSILPDISDNNGPMYFCILEKKE